MPQTTVLPQWKADFPILSPAQKPASVPKHQRRTASAAAWATGVATVTMPASTDYVGYKYTMTLAGFTPAGYNGTVTGTIASATTITFPLASDPGGAATVFGTVDYDAQIPINLDVTLPATAVPNKPQWSGTAGSLSLNQQPPDAPVIPLRNNAKPAK